MASEINYQELEATRSAIERISPEQFLQLPQDERLGRSWVVIDEQEGPLKPVLALPLEDITIRKGDRGGWCQPCAMQVVQMRSQPVRPSFKLSYQPPRVASWVGRFSVRINDGLDYNSTYNPEADNRRQDLFLPLVDAMIDSHTGDIGKIQRAGGVLADYVSRSLVPLALEDESLDLQERAREHRDLPTVIDQETLRESYDMLLDTERRIRAVAGSHHFDYENRQRSTVLESAISLARTSLIHAGVVITGREQGRPINPVIRARRLNTTSERAGDVTNIIGQTLGWEPTLVAVKPALQQLIAASAHPVFGRTSAAVAAAMEQVAA